MTAGAELDPVVALRELPTLLVGISAFITTKAGILFASGPGLGLTRAESIRVALTLAGGGEFSFVLFKLAQDLDVLPSDLAKLLTASVIISMSLTPLLGDLGDATGKWIESKDGTGITKVGDGLTELEAERLFDKIDVDKNGSIDLDELRTALLKLHIPFTAIADVFAAFDKDGDNEICRDEWEAGCDAGLLEMALKTEVPNVKVVVNDSISKESIVICGFGKMGRGVYNTLKVADSFDGDVLAFSLDPSRVTAGALAGAPVIFGDGARYDLFKAAGATTPRAVLITYASQSRRVNAVRRLRGSLPVGTPIYVFAENCRNAEELIDLGADDVVNEITESSLRFGSLLGLSISSKETNELRIKNFSGSTSEDGTIVKSTDIIPGWTDEELSDLAEEVNLTPIDLQRLYDIFSTLESNNRGDVPIGDLKDMIIRTSGKGPIDEGTLVRCMKIADENCDGNLTFEEFVRTSCLPAMKG